jgi:hypothetical protein
MTWMARDIELSNGAAAVAPDLCVLEPSTVFVAWLEASRGSIESSRSTDRGNTWSPATTMAPQERLSSVSVPRVLGDRRNQLYVSWHGLGLDGGSRIVLMASNTAGSSFLTTAITRPYRIRRRRSADRSEPRRSAYTMAADEVGNVYFAWLEQPAGLASGIGFDRVADYGRGWMHIVSGPPMGDHVPVDRRRLASRRRLRSCVCDVERGLEPARRDVAVLRRCGMDFGGFLISRVSRGTHAPRDAGLIRHPAPTRT